MVYIVSKTIRQFELQNFPTLFPSSLFPFLQFRFIYVTISNENRLASKTWELGWRKGKILGNNIECLRRKRL